eukprot:GHVU01116118.1.p1 GENE.GHVU01116118.1~~GHVU01116118.1.p1  ORF type:complete len:135 (+),score=5.11 GHVU01116118.1:126-530(+)
MTWKKEGERESTDASTSAGSNDDPAGRSASSLPPYRPPIYLSIYLLGTSYLSPLEIFGTLDVHPRPCGVLFYETHGGLAGGHAHARLLRVDLVRQRPEVQPKLIVEEERGGGGGALEPHAVPSYCISIDFVVAL